MNISEQMEAPARAIAAAKRGCSVNHPVIDRVWPSYVGQAKAAVVAFLEEAAQHRKSLRDRDRSGEAGQTAKQAGPEARARAEGIAQPIEGQVP